jgi:hypothetical protein
LRVVITDRVVNGQQMWGAVGGRVWLLYNLNGHMVIGDEKGCAEGIGVINNLNKSPVGAWLASDTWLSNSTWATMRPQNVPADGTGCTWR